MVYQEIYYEVIYVCYYLKGKKQDFFWWLEMLDWLGCVGIDKIGFGVLIGFFDNWCVDSYMVVEYLLWL